MAVTDALTVRVHLDFDLNGEPMTRVISQPGTFEVHEHGTGITVHLHLDAMEFARILYPLLLEQMRATGGS